MTPTPGPYEVLEEIDDDGLELTIYTLRGREFTEIARITQDVFSTPDRMRANAALLKQSPALLTALEALLASLVFVDGAYQVAGDVRTEVAKARLAVARAKGQRP